VPRHLREAHGPKKYLCDICTYVILLLFIIIITCFIIKATRKKSNLESHVKSHDGQPADGVKCPICNGTFMNQKGVKVHMIKVHNSDDDKPKQRKLNDDDPDEDDEPKVPKGPARLIKRSKK